MNNKSVSIEFTGIGGVGKSTIVQEVSKTLNEKDIEFNDLTMIKNKYHLRNLYPILKALYISILMKPKSIKSFLKILKGLSLYNIYSQQEKNKPISLYDEGVVHKARALKRHSNLKSVNEILFKLNKYIDLPDYLIIIKSSANKIYKRKISRGRINDNYDFQFIIDEINDYDFKKVIEKLKIGNNRCYKKVEVLKMNNENIEDINEISNQIVRLVEKIQRIYS